MNKTLLIAKKEFSDLLNNRIILLSIVTFIIILIIIIYNTLMIVSGSMPNTKIMFQDNPAMMVISRIFMEMLLYGSVLGVMIGCCSLSFEKASNALNVLIVKPVDRDTIINGKILRSLVFLFFMMLLIMIAYTLFMLQFYSTSILQHLSDYVARSMIALFIMLVYVTIFIAFSMFISTIIKKQSYAIIFSLIFVYLLEIIPDISQSLSIALAGIYEDAYYLVGQISDIAPKSLALSLQDILFDTSVSIDKVIISITPIFSGYLFLQSLQLCLLTLSLRGGIFPDG